MLPTHIGFFEGARHRRARRLKAARDALGIAGLLATAVLTVLVGLPS